MKFVYLLGALLSVALLVFLGFTIPRDSGQPVPCRGIIQSSPTTCYEGSLEGTFEAITRGYPVDVVSQQANSILFALDTPEGIKSLILQRAENNQLRLVGAFAN